MMSGKQKNTYDDLIKQLVATGVQFNDMSKKEAKAYLRERNYYDKIKLFRGTFMNLDGSYESVEFAAIADMANIDGMMREYLINVALGVEHGIRVELMNVLMMSPDIEETQLVLDFQEEKGFVYKAALRTLENHPYEKVEKNEFKAEANIGTLIDVMTMWMLSEFIEWLLEKYKNQHLADRKRLERILELMQYAQNIRNASAHSNRLLVDFFDDSQEVLNGSLVVESIAEQMGVSKISTHDKRIRDLIALFALHQELLSPEKNWYVYKRGRAVIKRMGNKPQYYEQTVRWNIFKLEFEKMVNYVHPPKKVKP